MSGASRCFRVLYSASILQPYRLSATSATLCAALSRSPLLTSCKGFSSNQQTLSSTPSKETLFRIDWLLENVVPRTLKTGIRPFFDICLDNVSFEDKLYKHKFSTKSQLLMHLAKIKLYYRYRSPFNKVERIGSCIYENENVIVLLWRLSTLQSSIWTYLPSFITRKEPKMVSIEGALDIYVNGEGMVYKIVNRGITASDREGAKAMEVMKMEREDARKKMEAREIRRKAEQLVEEKKRRGIL